MGKGENSIFGQLVGVGAKKEIEGKTVLLNQLLESIIVFNDIPNEHHLKMEFKLPYIGDHSEWNIVSNKKDSYTIIDSKKEITINIGNHTKN